MFFGEDYYNTQRGIPYFEQILGHSPPYALIKTLWNEEAKAYVPNVVTAQTFIRSVVLRELTGQVQVTNQEGLIGVTIFRSITPLGALTTSL